MEEPSAIFGVPGIWDSVFKQHERAFRSIEKLRAVARDLTSATKDSTQELVQVLNALAQICSETMFDVLLLAGNNRGPGAMKIARGMFEISVNSAYLEKNPNEVEAYLSFSIVEGWRHLQAVEKYNRGSVSSELMKQAETEYNRVKSRFSNAAGRVQFRWTNKSLRQMAEEVGMLNIYEIAYSPASELNHVPLIGIIAHELDWLREALFVAHGSLLQTVVSLYNVRDETALDFRSRINEAIADFKANQMQTQ
jgi:hypothetical protein